ncbi:hypothetical protein [Pseudomonas sp. PAB10]|uniref:hypothetical protein n=1 Tax=Pseudomonas sp. PAB10 TaxID=3233047 RepID=UPI003F9959CE
MGLRKLLAIVAIYCGVFVSANGLAAGPSTDLLVSGNVASSKTYTAKELEQFPFKEITIEFPDGDRKYRGALLRDIVTASKPLEPDKLALRQSYIIAKGTDDYFALFTWGELFLSPAGEEVFVVYRRDGNALPDTEGSFATIALKDSKPGPRYVKWLKSIEFRRISP